MLNTYMINQFYNDKKVHCGEVSYKDTFLCPIYSNLEWGNNRDLCCNCLILRAIKKYKIES